MKQLIQNSKASASRWDRFWFSQNDSTTIYWTRTFIGIVSLVLFAVYATQSSEWYGNQGWIDPGSGLQMIGDGIPNTGAEYRLTPFYVHPEWMIFGSIIGIGASVCLISGRFARTSAIISFVSLLILQARAPLFLERGEPLLLASLFYLALVPSFGCERLANPTAAKSPSSTSASPSNSALSGNHWLANLALRLIQTHFAIWIAFSLFSMLGYEGWWTGEAVRQLVEDRQGWLPDALAKLQFIELTAHAIIALQIALLLTILKPSFRFAGPIVLAAFLAAIMLVLGDWLYCVILAAIATSIWPICSQPLMLTTR